ncbi:MAG: hypothetical protein ACJ8FN_07620 [Sphingomicrobium sp.]
MGYLSTHEEIRAARLNSEEVADLLSRYPRVSDNEAGQILAFLRRGRHLDVGLLTSNDRLRPKLDAFMHDHKSHFRLKWSEGVAVSAGIVTLLLFLFLAWEVFAS